MTSNKYISLALLITICFFKYSHCSRQTIALRAERGRFTIVAALKDTQFKSLYKFLGKNKAVKFDPRHAGSLRTDGNPHDENRNLHITLATTNLGTLNEKACIYALNKIAEHFNAEIHVTFNPSKIRHDKWSYVILPLEKDEGYESLVVLQKIINEALRSQNATGIHVPLPDHVTIGYATELPRSKYRKKIKYGIITHARVYHWVGHGEEKYPPRDEFYPKAEVQIYQ